MIESSHRFDLPLLAAAQAQKEVTHNEAIALIDLLVNPVVQSIAQVNIPAAPQPGQAWIVGNGATGVWTGNTNKIAGWTINGWRFIAPAEGMSLWSLSDAAAVQFNGIAWAIATLSGQQVSIGGNKVLGARLGAIAGPAGGAIIDAEARTVIGLILTMLNTHGLIAT